jgi:DNA mismatch repair protein MutS2
LQLDESIKAVVISGPNAGGKTVTIKTVALFALMHQSLYMLPAAEGTSLPMFHAIYTDIGDDQSIEDSLSTFSAHMKHIGKILNQCDKQSLVIFDELGSGTDPVEGSAIARAVLEYCVEHAGLSLVTSHHSVLKQYAYAHAQVLNASMEFDGKTHEPTFRVISGLPGESHAIDTARRMGLPDTVISQAEAYLGSEVVEISAIIRGLEERRREAELREQTLDDRARKLTEQLRAMDLQKLRLKQREQQVREEQIGDLSRFIADKRKELENLVAELREGEITRAKTRKVKSFISSLQEKKEDSERRVDAISEKPEPPNSPISFSVGMDVLAGVHRREGRIVRKEKNGTWMVAIGPMKFPMKEEDLKPVSPRTKKGTSKISVVYESTSAPVQATIDVRGKTLSEALESVAVQVEGALVHAMQEFAIIHGMGDGILSRGIHEYLGNHPRVKHYYFARPEDGGYGKTYVQL